MIKKQTLANKHIEKVLLTSGLAAVIVGCVAGAYSLYMNRRFLTGDPLASIYYFTNILLLGGGFAAGYFLTPKSKDKRSRLFTATTYALLAFVFYFLLDTFRFYGLMFVLNLFGQKTAAFDIAAFQLAPIVTLIVIGALAYLTQMRVKRVEVSKLATWTVLISFLGYNLYTFGYILYGSLVAPNGFYADSSYPLWLFVASFLVNPLIVAGVTYLLLSQVKQRFTRLFYAVFVGVFAQVLSYVLFDFRQDASAASTNLLQAFIVLITLLSVGLILFKSRSVAKK